MKKELRPFHDLVSCDICGRTILKGEQAENYLAPGADRKHVLITNSDTSLTLDNPSDAARDLVIVCCEQVPSYAGLSPQGDRIAASLDGSSAIPGCLLCADAPAAVVIIDVDGGSRRLGRGLCRAGAT